MKRAQRPVKANFTWDSFQSTLRAADGEKTNPRCILKSARDEWANTDLEPGEEGSIRVLFELPKNTDAKTITFAEGDSRSYSFDLKL